MSAHERLLQAAKTLRAAQRHYVANRGDDAIGRLVRLAGDELDKAIDECEAPK